MRGDNLSVPASGESGRVVRRVAVSSSPHACPLSNKCLLISETMTIDQQLP
jgi:hypothetical protein